MTIAQRFFAADLRHMLALSDQRKAENAATRKRLQADADLCALLLQNAQRRGQQVIDWPEYFRNVAAAD